VAAIDTTGYDYAGFVRGVEQLHGTGCFVRRVLIARLRAGKLDMPNTVLSCDGLLDGHHVLSKERVKQRFPFGGEKWPDSNVVMPLDRIAIPPPGTEIALGELLSDPRLGVLGCRRHHSLIENGVIVLARRELPAEVDSVAVEFGLDAWLDRDYGTR
jgi:hypothetical protein